MARPDGVVIVSEGHWAFAGRDGSLREGTMPSLPASIHGIPFARGLARLGLSLAPLFRPSGVAGRREKPFLLAALVAPFLLFVLPGSWRTPIGVAATLALAVWMLRGVRSACMVRSIARSPRSKSGTSSRPGTASCGQRGSHFAAERISPHSLYR